MNLKARLSLLALLLILASASAVWVAVQTLAERIIAEWAQRYVEKQVLYDKERVLQPLLREIVLARQLASSPILLEWLQTPDDIVLEYRALRELERYREAFRNGNYFLAAARNGHYYYNNAENEYASDQLRYILNPREPSDRWFYEFLKQERELVINVNPDAHLGITKMWIDIQLRGAGGEVLGVAGTGINLSGFLEDIVDSGEEGITSLFVNHEGSIQLYRDQSLIDFASYTKEASERSHLGRMLSATDHQRLLELMEQVRQSPTTVMSRFVHIDGKRYLAGLAYLPEVDWYEITLMDLNQLLPLSKFNTILLVFSISLLLTLLIFQLVLGRWVLAPLSSLDQVIRAVRQGQYKGESLDIPATGEIGRLVREFELMTREVYEARTNLELKVQERTEALNRLSQTDALTGLLNRRGMDQKILEELKRCERERRSLGIIWIDLDYFKEINDVYGHAVGDDALVLVAKVLRSVLREYDAAARWGGDEFLIMLRDADGAMLNSICERLLRVIRSQVLESDSGTRICMTFSIGACLAQTASAETALHRADAALYAAKESGRNCYRIAEGQPVATAEATTVDAHSDSSLH